MRGNHPHHDALVITTKVGNNYAHRMLVNNRSAINILYLNAFNKIGVVTRIHEASHNIIVWVYKRFIDVGGKDFPAYDCR